MAAGSPSITYARPKRRKVVRKKSSATPQGSPSVPAARPVARRQAERKATRAYRPPSSATPQGSPSVPKARPKKRQAQERAATKKDTARRKKYVWTETAGGKKVEIPRSQYEAIKRNTTKVLVNRRLAERARNGTLDDALKPAGLKRPKLAGTGLDNALGPIVSKLNPLGPLGGEIARATLQDPGAVFSGTLKGGRDTVVGLPSGVAKLVTDPKGAAKETVKDYKRRYGPLLSGDNEKFRERIKKEGAFSELMDVAGAAGGGGSVVGKLRKAGGHVPEPRPKLRTSGGAPREQTLSDNPLKAGLQRGQDKARAKYTARRVQQAAEGHRVSALDVSVKPGEVAPLRRARKQTVDVAARKSRGVHAMKSEQAREVHKGAARNIAKLNKSERRAFKYTVQLGLPDNPHLAAAHLARRRDQIVKAREGEGTVIPPALAKTNDELPVIDKILAAPEKHFTPRLRGVANKERDRNLSVSASDPGLVAKQRLLRRYAPLAHHLDIVRKEGEGAAPFARRVQAEAKQHGLERPGYFKSQKRQTIRHAEYALGGTKAVAEDKSYTGALFRTGREDTSPQVHLDSLASNIKRKHNWNAVADNFDRHAFAWGKNQSLAKLQDELDHRGIDPKSVAFWNPRKYRDARRALGDGADHMPVADEAEHPGIYDAVTESAVDARGLATKGEDFKNTAGWSVVPKAVYDEVHTDTKPSGALARTWDVAKAKQSRILLGTNPPWAAFQVGSNALLTGLARTGPVDAIKAQMWWKGLDPKLREAVEPYVGIGPFQGDVAQPKLGASADNRLVNGYRAFKATPLMRRAGQANPLDALFRFDNMQNNAFRRSVLYSQAKRDAYRRMGEDVSLAGQAQARLHGLFTLGPKEKIDAVLKNRDALERHAAHVNDMLGDYATYTAKERRILGRSVMFYGFLRYSLNFTFHTMPIHHPVMTDLIGNLSQLQTEEVRKILGGDELPFALGRIYLKKNGKLEVVDLTRLNPASNTLVEAASSHDVGKLLGMMPPVVGTAFDLLYGKSSFKGRNLRVEGQNSGGANAREATGEKIPLKDAGRIALERTLQLAYPYRAGERVVVTGPQGDDTLLWDPRPTKYKRDDIVRSIEKQKRENDPKQALKEQLLPFMPKPTNDPEFAQSIRDRRGTPKGKVKKKTGDPLGLTGKSMPEDDPLGLGKKVTKNRDPLGIGP